MFTLCDNTHAIKAMPEISQGINDLGWFIISELPKSIILRCIQMTELSLTAVLWQGESFPPLVTRATILGCHPEQREGSFSTGMTVPELGC